MCIILTGKKWPGEAIFKLTRCLFLSRQLKVMNKIINYIKASIEELKKVTWPTKKETYLYTVLVIVISLVVAAYLGGLDYIFTLGLKDFLFRL